MTLRITRPALAEALEKRGRDIDHIPHQEMRTLVCAQCHVEYYFKNQTAEKKDNYLTFPWDKGMTPEKMEEYYDSIPRMPARARSSATGRTPSASRR